MKIRIPTFAAAAALTLLMAGCAAPPPPPAPVPAPKPMPVEVPPAPPVLVQPKGEWVDWPITAGDWKYRRDPGGSVADYMTTGGPTILSFRCNAAAGQIVMARSEDAVFAGVSVHVITSSAARDLGARREDGGGEAGRIISVLSAYDPILDAIIFSRGRFAVEAAGQLSIAIPAWPEIAHVVEDCRSH